MKYLLDTHTFLWTVADIEKLSEKVTNIIEAPEHDIFVSAISFWEISIKHRLGKLHLGKLNLHQLLNITEKMGFQTLPLTPHEALSQSSLRAGENKDPFDRMLVWQSIHNKVTLLSRDTRLHHFKPDGLKVVW